MVRSWAEWLAVYPAEKDKLEATSKAEKQAKDQWEREAKERETARQASEETARINKACNNWLYHGADEYMGWAGKPVDYVWDGIAVAGKIVLIAGGVGEGKTTLLTMILAARANMGEPVSLLGRKVFPAPRGQHVVLVESEMDIPSISRKVVQSCHMLGIPQTAMDRWCTSARQAVQLTDDDSEETGPMSSAWATIKELVRRGEVSDLAIDTLARFAPGDANAEDAQANIFDTLARLINSAPFQSSADGLGPGTSPKRHRTQPRRGVRLRTTNGASGLCVVGHAQRRSRQTCVEHGDVPEAQTRPG